MPEEEKPSKKDGFHSLFLTVIFIVMGVVVVSLYKVDDAMSQLENLIEERLEVLDGRIQ